MKAFCRPLKDAAVTDMPNLLSRAIWRRERAGAPVLIHSRRHGQGKGAASLAIAQARGLQNQGIETLSAAIAVSGCLKRLAATHGRQCLDQVQKHHHADYPHAHMTKRESEWHVAQSAH